MAISCSSGKGCHGNPTQGKRRGKTPPGSALSPNRAKKPSVYGERPSFRGKKPSSPEKKPSSPEKKPSSPEKKPSSPEKKPSFPAKKPSFPEKKPSLPGERPSFLGKKPSFPGEKPSFPGKKPSFPDKKPSLFPEKPSFPGEKRRLLERTSTAHQRIPRAVTLTISASRILSRLHPPCIRALGGPAGRTLRAAHSWSYGPSIHVKTEPPRPPASPILLSRYV